VSAQPVPSPADVMIPASAEVNIKDVNPILMQYVVHMAYVHKLLFGAPLVITSGKDSIHAPGSLHGQGRAVDVRLRDLSEADQIQFLCTLVWSAPANKVAVFDERALGAESHVHIEYHGE
jgi:hypothetical protein